MKTRIKNQKWNLTNKTTQDVKTDTQKCRNKQINKRRSKEAQEKDIRV